MRIISFNVNGIKSMSSKVKSGEKTGNTSNNCLKSLIEDKKPDILCLQEIKTQNPKDLEFLRAYFKYIYVNCSTIKKGYSGTAILTNTEPEWVSNDFTHFPEEEIGAYKIFDFIKEGRLITIKYPTFVLINSYTPNSQPELARLEERIEWEELIRNYLVALEIETGLPVILCGDLNCAHQEIDLHNPKGKNKTAGFSTEERAEFSKMLELGFVDTFRYLHPKGIKYSYWSNFANSRARDVGWRIDYFLISESAKDKIVEADCIREYCGSDHGPVLCDFDILI